MKNIQIKCPNCNAMLELDEEFIGQTCSCPVCNHEFVAQKPGNATGVFCSKCGKKLAASAQFCDHCGTPVGQSASFKFGNAVHSASDKLHSAVSAATGLDKSVDFSLKSFFSEVFKHHNDADYQEVFCRGYESNTPTLDQIDDAWPKPWVYSRVLVFALLSFGVLLATMFWMPNLYLVPGILFMGPVAFQIAMMFFFYEMNILKDISLPKLLIVFFVIGVISLLIALYFFRYNTLGTALSEKLHASAAGPIEELAKLFAVVLFSNLTKKKDTYILNGMLLGIAVGAGFSAFESAGYALKTFLMTLFHYIDHVNNGHEFQDLIRFASQEQAFKTIMLRSFLQIGAGHALWTAICAGALWKVKGRHSFRTSMLWNWNFLRIALIAVGSHMLHNSDWLMVSYDHPTYYIREIIISIINWAVVIALLKTGINQVIAQKRELASSAESETSPNA